MVELVLHTLSLLFLTSLGVKGRVADSHQFNADPDPSFCCHADLDPTFHFNADPDPDLDPAPHQSDANLRPSVYRPSRSSILSLHASIVSVNDPPQL